VVGVRPAGLGIRRCFTGRHLSSRNECGVPVARLTGRLGHASSSASATRHDGIGATPRNTEAQTHWWLGSAGIVRLERPSTSLRADDFEGPFGHYMSLAEDVRGNVHVVWGVGRLFSDASRTRGEICYTMIHWRGSHRNGRS
jgi:hypothetical protein